MKDLWQQQQRVQTICLVVLCTIAIAATLKFTAPVIVPFVLAFFFATCLTPVIDIQTKKLGLPRFLAVGTTAVVAVVLLLLVGLAIASFVGRLSTNAAAYERYIDSAFQRVERTVDSMRSGWFDEESPGGIQEEEIKEAPLLDDEHAHESAPTPLEGSLEHAADQNFPPTSEPPVRPGRNFDGSFATTTIENAVKKLLSGIAGGLMALLSNGILVLIFVIFMIAGGGRQLPEGSILSEARERIKRYVLTLVFTSGATGLLVGITLSVLGVKFAWVFGFLAFMLNFIPSIGSIIATLLPIPVILLDPNLSPLAMVLAIAIPTAVQFLIGNLLQPRLMGRSLGLHPVVVLLALIFFGMMWGIIGMFLATPITAVIKLTIERLPVVSPVADLLAGRLDRFDLDRTESQAP